MHIDPYADKKDINVRTRDGNLSRIDRQNKPADVEKKTEEMILDEEVGYTSVERIVGRLKPHQTVVVEGSRDTITRDMDVNTRGRVYLNAIRVSRAELLTSFTLFLDSDSPYPLALTSTLLFFPFSRRRNSYRGWGMHCKKRKKYRNVRLQLTRNCLLVEPRGE